MADRDFSLMDPAEFRGYSIIHDFSGMFTQSLANSYPPMEVKTLKNFVAVVSPTTGAEGTTFLCSRDGSLSPLHIIGRSSSPPGANGHLVEYADVLIGGVPSGSTPYGMNLRENGVARNINNAAALAGVVPITPNTSAGTGWKALNNQGVATYYDWKAFQDDRHLVPVSSENTTSPSVAAPVGAPAVAPASTGKLANGTYDVAFAWVTRLNTRRTGQGITTPSPTVSQAVSAGGTGSISVVIPAAPAYATGYVVYAVETGGTLRAVGGGIALAGGTTHVIKNTMAGLAMGTRFFINGSSQIQKATIGTLENSNPITYSTARSVTSQFNDCLWSPFFKDPTQLFCLPSSGNWTQAQKADLYDLGADTISLNQTTSPDGQPCLIQGGGTQVQVTATRYQSIPEAMAYAILGTGAWSGDAVSTPGFIQIRSCLTNELLYSWVDEIIHQSSDPSGVGSYSVGFADFEPYFNATGATKSVDLLIGSRRHRGVIRKPVGWYK